MRPKLAAAGSALLVLAAGCSSAGHGAVGPAHVSAPGATSPATGTGPAAPVASISATQASWTLPGVSRAVVLPSRGGFVVLGGLAVGDTTSARIVQVDPATGHSRTVGSLADPVHDAAGAVIDDRYFVLGGGSSSSISTVQAWTAGAGAEVGRLPAARSDLSAATIAGTTYIVGGFDGSAMTPAVLATTDGMSFKTVAQLEVPVRYAAVAALGKTLWVVGGVTSTSESGTSDTDAVQKVDLVSGRTTVTSRLSEPVGHATALVLDGQILVLGGRSGTVPSAAIWRLDPASGALIPAGRLPRPVSDAAAVGTGGTGYLVGGEVTGPAAPLDTVVTLQPGTRRLVR